MIIRHRNPSSRGGAEQISVDPKGGMMSIPKRICRYSPVIWLVWRRLERHPVKWIPVDGQDEAEN